MYRPCATSGTTTGGSLARGTSNPVAVKAPANSPLSGSAPWGSGAGWSVLTAGSTTPVPGSSDSGLLASSSSSACDPAAAHRNSRMYAELNCTPHSSNTSRLTADEENSPCSKMN